MKLIKAHAYGNDFLLHEGRIGSHADWSATGRAACDRHRGIGADGLIVFAFGAGNDVAMRLINADGSPSEVSGNGVRCLAAWIAASRSLEPGAAIGISTDAGVNPFSNAPEYRNGLKPDPGWRRACVTRLYLLAK